MGWFGQADAPCHFCGGRGPLGRGEVWRHRREGRVRPALWPGREADAAEEGGDAVFVRCMLLVWRDETPRNPVTFLSTLLFVFLNFF